MKHLEPPWLGMDSSLHYKNEPLQKLLPKQQIVCQLKWKAAAIDPTQPLAS